MKRYLYRLKWVNVEFEFESLGPRGVIKKIVSYQTKWFDGMEMVNLGLGDWDGQGRYADDDVTSNNHDTKVVLATVASTCVALTSLHPTIQVYAEGTTPARNRLYRIGIVKNWNEIDPIFEIDGKRFGKWEPFQPNINYDAFRAKRK